MKLSTRYLTIIGKVKWYVINMMTIIDIITSVYFGLIVIDNGDT